MGFSYVDYAIVVVYLAGVTVAGIVIAGRQRSARDYFLGGKEMAWWSVGFSIVASETSTLTFISIPGLAYRGDMRFMQLVFGYFIGRVLVSLLFIPAYYRGDLETAYDFIGKRFGIGMRKITSSIFIVTRVLASGVRLFATAIPLHFVTGLDYPTSILLIGAFTLAYTAVGGLKAVVAMDVVQLFLYLTGAAVSMGLILSRLPGGWSDVVYWAQQEGSKFRIFHLSADAGGIAGFFASPYTLAGGLLGGTFLTMASHGTDQLLVQRLLGCRSVRESQKALILDASAIVLQFAFFLVLGLCLYAYYHGAPLAVMGLSSFDEVFPRFIVQELPHGLAGLLVAGIFASAMGTLSSSISSLASSTYLDLMKRKSGGEAGGGSAEMRWSRLLTLFWGTVLIGGAMLFTDSRSPVVEIGITIASYTSGGLLGVFFMGRFFHRVDHRDALAGLLIGLAVMAGVLFGTSIANTWHTLIGASATMAAGYTLSVLRSSRATPPA
jgi:SSS family solute:Na+ symporter